MDKGVKKIVFTGESGFGRLEDAYTERLSITEKGVSYTYTPRVHYDMNLPRKWKYTTDNFRYKRLFYELSEMIQDYKDKVVEDLVDVGALEIQVVFEDGTSWKREFYIEPFFSPDGDGFLQMFEIINKFVPQSEEYPRFSDLEDYEEDEDEEDEEE
ncbi:hypothetical protein [Butyrivibrio sp. AD3002]|uniref:hypothetical protein n=1 Tax=Butyrivibrio sp. AD3002 TaxID=1280670 RepID=UPI0003B433A0|nr:hypothetical protein [Butyrivibrio sp. AD3002]